MSPCDHKWHHNCSNCAPGVPRVASSLDDLRVGQVVAWNWREEGWSIHRIKEVSPSYAWTADGAGLPPSALTEDSPVVILSDPPPEPVTVSLEAFDRLAEATREWGNDRMLGTDILDAARALVEEVRGADA